MTLHDAMEDLLKHNRKVAIAIIEYILAQPGHIARSQDIADMLQQMGEEKGANPREYGLYRLSNLIIVSEGAGPGVTYRIAPGAVKFLKELIKLLESEEKSSHA